MEAVAEAGRQVVALCKAPAANAGLAAAKFVVFANAVGDNPFMAGAFHGIGEADSVISVGISGPGVVERALQKVRGRPFEECAAAIKRLLFRLRVWGS